MHRKKCHPASFFGRLESVRARDSYRGKVHRHTVPILKNYLGDERLSLTQIAELMDFSSLSHFSRYCTKHLGQSPTDYRQSLQPKGK